MPSLRVHCYIDRRYFGRAYPKLHRAIDKPFSVLGRGHRVLYHDYFTAYYIARRKYPGDPCAVKAAALHIEYDNICTRDPNYRRLLENLAKKDVAQRKKIKRWGNQLMGKTKRTTRKRRRRKGSAVTWKSLSSKKKIVSIDFWIYGNATKKGNLIVCTRILM